MFKRKNEPMTNHVVIVTSDAADAGVKQFRIKRWMLQVIILVLCVIIGALIGYLIYEGQFWDAMHQKNLVLQEEVTSLKSMNAEVEAEKLQTEAQLEARIEELQAEISILSDTVNQKLQVEKELTARLEALSLPTEFPLSGSAVMEETTEGDPMCIFSASEGTTVVAAAEGTVTAVHEDAEYGHSVWIDHGNGYVTIYRNDSKPVVKEGDSVVQGTTLFLIGEDNTKLGYQMQLDGAYISPTSMLSISG